MKINTFQVENQTKNTSTTVIFVIFQTGNRANGGVESITQVIENLENIKPIIITQLETPFNQRWEKAGAEVKVWPIPYSIGDSLLQGNYLSKWQRFKSLLLTNYQMFKLVKTSKYRVIHCNDPSAFWHTILGAKMAQASVIFNIRDVKPLNENYGFKWKIAFKISDRQLVLSREMGETLAKRLSISPKNIDKISYIYSIVDLKKMTPVNQEKRLEIRQKLKIDSDKFAIGYIATFSPKKAQLDFIEKAGKNLKKSLPQAKIYFLGDFEPNNNKYAHSCQQATQKLNLENSISFIGYTNQISHWYQALDVIIVPTKNEGLARCSIESIACGTPVISFNVCSAKEILEENQCGIVVEMNDYQALVAKITMLASNRELSLMLGNNGAQIAKKLFEASKIVQEYKKIYQK